jgi:hypothetical protein
MRAPPEKQTSPGRGAGAQRSSLGGLGKQKQSSRFSHLPKNPADRPLRLLVIDPTAHPRYCALCEIRIRAEHHAGGWRIPSVFLPARVWP